uniref:Isocitrate dehydrogenase (NAD(+)) 3 non-catalytic subunit gamma n=1 Tax=Cyprinus carpio TaxID=7962 RepID=A0A8C1UIR2_CYPCA
MGHHTWLYVTSLLISVSKCQPPPAEYGGRHTVTLIPGDGIGPELLNHVREIFRFEDEARYKQTSPENTKDELIFLSFNNGLKLKCHYSLTPMSFQTRKNLYANVMHCQSLPGVPTHHKDIDVIIIRENKEGEYSSLEHENVPGVVESLKIITHVNPLRIAEYAFNLAREKGRRKVTYCFSCASYRKLGDGLFLQCCKEVAAGCPDITFVSMIVDNTTMQLVSKPQHFDMMVMPNLYGNVVSNVCAGLVGGPGLVPGVNYAKSTAHTLTIPFYPLSIVTADLGGQDVTSKVVQSIMQEIQRGGPRTSEQIRT